MPLYYTTLHYTALHTLHYTTLCYTNLHYDTLHHTKLHYTTLHYTLLHYTRVQLNSCTALYGTLSSQRFNICLSLLYVNQTAWNSGHQVLWLRFDCSFGRKNTKICPWCIRNSRSMRVGGSWAIVDGFEGGVVAPRCGFWGLELAGCQIQATGFIS